ncbi:MAG: hypothetical protein GYA17_01500 [Chloroflexi bacterium]|nr:hypothetical protein [Anaerolineaceae bacterium]NMB87001.1 hypothetical protein [Chloroflexota bacterium]
MEPNNIYQGFAQVYLEGKSALQPVERPALQCTRYYLGSSESRITLTDYREEANRAAIRAIDAGDDRYDFAETFCRPAEVHIASQDGHIAIQLWPWEGRVAEHPILWIGVTEIDELPANPVSWLALRNDARKRPVFAALVEPNPVYEP